MDRMFRVLGFWLLMIGLMFMAGEMFLLAILFGVQAILFFHPRLHEVYGTYLYVDFRGIYVPRLHRDRILVFFPGGLNLHQPKTSDCLTALVQQAVALLFRQSRSLLQTGYGHLHSLGLDQYPKSISHPTLESQLPDRPVAPGFRTEGVGGGIRQPVQDPCSLQKPGLGGVHQLVQSHPFPIVPCKAEKFTWDVRSEVPGREYQSP